MWHKSCDTWRVPHVDTFELLTTLLDEHNTAKLQQRRWLKTQPANDDNNTD